MGERYGSRDKFKGFSLDVNQKVLLRGGEMVDLPPKAIEMLIVLLRNRGKVVTKKELLDSVWGDAFVEESVLSNNVYLLRKAIGEIEPGKQIIQTIPRRGYKFEDSFDDPSSQFVLEHHVFEQTLIEDVSNNVEAGDPTRLAPGVRLHGAKTRSFSAAAAAIAALGLIVVVIAGYAFWADRVSGKQPAFVSFSGENKVLTDFGFTFEKGRALVVQPDGRIVVGGWAGESQGTSDIALARYLPDGSLDPTFGSGGRVLTTIGPRSDIVYALALQQDGKIVAAGVTFEGPEDRRFCMIRYQSDGTLDPTFDNDGVVTLNIGDRQRDTAYAVAIQSDGKIVVAGSASMKVATTDLTALGQNDIGLVRLESDGSTDQSFGKNGSVVTNLGFGFDIGYALTLQPDGRIVVAGSSTNGANNDFAVLRFLSDGQRDPTFGNAGHVRTDFESEDDSAFAVHIQDDGRLLVAGYATKDAHGDFAVARYLPNGALDLTFNTTGKQRIDFDGGNDVAFGIKTMADGRIIVGGHATTHPAPEIGIVRLMPDGRLDLSFADAGRSRSSIATHTETWGIDLVSDRYALAVGNSGDGRSASLALSRIRL